MKDSESRRTEWLLLMTELAALDRAAYREIRSEAWARVAMGHASKTAEQLEVWLESAS